MIINYSKDISEVLAARENLVRLYCFYNQFEKAKEQVQKFPEKINTQSMQMAWVNRAEKNTEEEYTPQKETA